MARITRKIVVHAPFADVAPRAMASGPGDWPEWYVGLSAPTRVSGEGEVGTVSEHSILLVGRQFPITHEVVEITNDGSTARWKGTFEGSFEGWHRWTYLPVDGATEIEVEHQYTLPGGPVGRFADTVIVERMIARMIEQTLENLKMILETPISA
jgi:coenzyme Q-binding protein COQ10